MSKNVDEVKIIMPGFIDALTEQPTPSQSMRRHQTMSEWFTSLSFKRSDQTVAVIPKAEESYEASKQTVTNKYV